MKKVLLLISIITVALMSNAQDMMITGVYDGPLAGGHPKGVELYVINAIADLSTYGIGSANNGQGTDGEEFTFPAVAAVAGQFIYVAADSAGFRDFMGFDADYISGAMAINGDDAVELFSSSVVIDLFGDINVDGTGQPWEHLDGWAYRNCSTPSSTFVLAEWSFSGINALDNEVTNAAATTPIPAGTYNCGPQPVAPASVSFASATDSRMENDATNDTIWINLSKPATRTDSVYVSATDVSATYTTDYTTTPDLSSGALFEVNAADTAIMIILNMVDDLVFEGNETFTLSIDSVTDSLTIGANASLTYTVTENEISINPVVDWNSTADNITEASAAFALDMSFSLAITQTDTIWVEVVNGAGVVYGAANDYSIDSTITNDTVMIFVDATDNGTEINFTVNDDVLSESTETVTFNIVAVSGDLVLGSDLSRVVTITDNDVPPVLFTSIVDIQTPGAGSDSSTYKGDAVSISGIVTAVKSGTGYWVQEANGGPFSGIYVFDGTNMPLRGDSVIVDATVDEFFNSTQLENVTAFTNVSSGNSFVITDLAPMAVNDEQYESVMVRVAPNVVKNNSLGFGEYSLGNGNDTTRIDDFLHSYVMPAVGDSVGVTGVVGYSFDNFKIFPRDSADILEISVTPPSVLTISGIQTPLSPTGDSPFDGSTVTTSGIVTAVKDSSAYWIQEANGGPYSGVYVYDFNHYPQIGDSVVLTGGVVEFFNLTELSGVTNFQIISSGNAFTISDVTTDEMSSEQWEGVMVKLSAATCIGDTSSGFGEWVIDDGSGAAKANDFLYVFAPVINTVYDITGVVDYNFSEFKINPRFEADIVETIVGINSDVVTINEVYPNPATNSINVNLNVNDAVVSIIDLTGKTLMTERVISYNNTLSIDGLTSGLYFVEVKTENSIELVKFIKK